MPAHVTLPCRTAHVHVRAGRWDNLGRSQQGVEQPGGEGVIRRPDSDIAELAQELRRLRERAGLSLTQLAKHCWCSKSSLERYLNGKVFPPREVVAAISDACGGDTPAMLALWEKAWAARDVEQQAHPTTPRQLPPDVRGFTGRTAELARLDDLLADGTDAVVIAGTAGVGKTALAVRWARKVAGRFPDGQLSVNLRGYDPRQPMAPEQALTVFLRALGVPGPEIPVELDGQAGLYRSLLADRRMLILLDNASSPEQVRPMLPGAPGCLVVVTSRDEMTGLVTRDGAARLRVDVLSLDDSIALLRLLLMPAMEEPESGALDRLAELCARLPLALRIAADRVGSYVASDLTVVVSAFERARLDALGADGDPYTAVRAVFSWSYRELSPIAAAMFRGLGLIPGSDWDVHAAAAIMDVPPADVGELLRVLTDAHLVEPSPYGRFQMHDLLRAYAIDRIEAEEAPADRLAALHRLFAYYVQAAGAAMDVVAPHDAGTRPRIAEGARPAPELASVEEATEWLASECANLLAAATEASVRGFPYTTALSGILARYLDFQGQYQDALLLHHLALGASRESGDHAGEAAALSDLGRVSWRLGRLEDAEGRYRQALAILREVADPDRESRVVGNLGLIYKDRGLFVEALQCFRDSAAIGRRHGDRVNTANALNNLGTTYRQLGQRSEACQHIEEALAIYEEIGYRVHEGCARGNLGELDKEDGRYPDAIERHRQALAIFREVAAEGYEGWAHVHLGEVYSLSGRHAEAIEHYHQALDLARRMGDHAIQRKTMNHLGAVYRLVHRYADAIEHHRAALKLSDSAGDRYEQARALDGVAHTRFALGDHADATKHWELALALYAEMGVPEAGEVQVKLDELHSSAIWEGPSAG